MCTLCDMIKGIKIVIDYIKNIAIGLGLLAFSVGGVMYAVSAGDKGLIDSAKAVMRNAITGFLVIFGAWLIVNTTIDYLGTQPGMNIHVVSWGEFECTANPNR